MMLNLTHELPQTCDVSSSIDIAPRSAAAKLRVALPLDHNQLLLGVRSPVLEARTVVQAVTSTQEQESIYRFAGQGVDLCINAFAGSGKTSTAVTIAEKVKQKGLSLHV